MNVKPSWWARKGGLVVPCCCTFAEADECDIWRSCCNYRAWVAFQEGGRSDTEVCSVFIEQIWRMTDTESRGCVMKDCKASADTAALGYYTRLCPMGCSPWKVTRQQKWIPVLGYPSELPGFLEPAGTPGWLCLPCWCTQCAAHHLPFCTFCWLSAKE